MPPCAKPRVGISARENARIRFIHRLHLAPVVSINVTFFPTLLFWGLQRKCCLDVKGWP